MRILMHVPLDALRVFDVVGPGEWSPGPKLPDPPPNDPPTRPDEGMPPERPFETPAVPSIPELPLPTDPPEDSPTFERCAA